MESGQMRRPEARLLDLPEGLKAEVAVAVSDDHRSLLAVRQSSKGLRSLVDSSISNIKVIYDGDGMGAPPDSPEELEKALTGLVRRGCKPLRLRIRLSSYIIAENQVRGLAALRGLSAPASLKTLELHNLELSKEVVEHIGVAAPGLAKISLSGTSTSDESLQVGLPALPGATPQLEELVLLNPGRPPASVWRSLGEFTALRSLNLSIVDPYGCFCSDWPIIMSVMAELPRLQSLSLAITPSKSLTSTLRGSLTRMTGLASLSLSIGRPPAAMLRRLATLPRLETLCMHGDRITGMGHLPGLTALTSLTLGKQDGSYDIERAVDSSLDRTWALPPRLRELCLHGTVSVAHLEALTVPSTLGRCSMALALPDSEPAATQQLLAIRPRLIAWGVDELALTPAGITRLGRGQLMRELGPLQLRQLRLHNMVLEYVDIEALGDALGPSLQRLMVDGCPCLSSRQVKDLLQRLPCLTSPSVRVTPPPAQ